MSTREPPAGGDLEVLRGEADRLGVALDEAQYEAFARYLALLEQWRERAGLTAVRDPSEVQRRHFGEALALLVALRAAGLLPPADAAAVVDLGSGAGFPGLAMRVAAPALQLTLVESNGRRCDFLRAVCADLGLHGVTVVQARAEDAAHDASLRERFDIASARALAALPVLIEYGVPLLRPGGVLVSPKGSALDDEIAASTVAADALGSSIEPPLTLPLPPDAQPQRVAVVRRTGPLDPRYPRRAGMPSKRPLGSVAAAARQRPRGDV